MSEGGPETNACMQFAETFTNNLDEADQQEVLDPAEALKLQMILYTPSGSGNPENDHVAYNPADGTFDF